MPVVVAIVAVWLVVGAGAALLMHRKGHDMFSWSILFIALGPLAVPLAISAHRHPPARRRAATTRAPSMSSSATTVHRPPIGPCRQRSDCSARR